MATLIDGSRHLESRARKHLVLRRLYRLAMWCIPIGIIVALNVNVDGMIELTVSFREKALGFVEALLISKLGEPWDEAVGELAWFVFTWGVLGSPVILWLLCRWRANFHNMHYGILTSGIQGETLASNLFSGLPAEYTVFSNAVVTTGTATVEMDHVIVGPTGVFVVETKNFRGKISGHSDDADITQQKRSRGGKGYRSVHRNPVRQVKRHVHHLAVALRGEGVHAWVQGAVYFSHPKADVAFHAASLPIFSAKAGGGRDLLQYILAYDKQPLTPANQQQVVEFLRSAAA